MESRTSRMFVGAGGTGVVAHGCFGEGERVVIVRAPRGSALGGAAVCAVGTEGRQETASGERAPRCQLGAGAPGVGWGGRWQQPSPQRRNTWAGTAVKGRKESQKNQGWG